MPFTLLSVPAAQAPGNTTERDRKRPGVWRSHCWRAAPFS